MVLRKTMLIGAMCLIATTLIAKAQAQYQPYPPYSYQAYPYTPVPAAPPSWSYDPYTSGFGPCPQRLPNDSTSCRQQMPPTYGQPDFRTR
jgi:hypothetical protein